MKATRALTALVLVAGCLEAPPGAPPEPAADAATTDGGLPSSACDDVFGAARGYVLCDSDDSSCTFYLNLDGDFSCATACDGFGVACLDGWDDTDTANQCEVEVRIGCDDAHSDEICQCARPPA
jgi:hypothetical protein